MKTRWTTRDAASLDRWAASLDEKDRALLMEALEALLRERRRAMELSRVVLSERAQQAIGLEDFGIGEVLRAARALAGRGTCG
jgi:hypothetical protein